MGQRTSQYRFTNTTYNFTSRHLRAGRSTLGYRDREKYEHVNNKN
jgi:hypothetical protein